jgi:predicted RNase H-like nuclease (RuvC/YqgF family)
VGTRTDRITELENALTEANRQLLNRDEELIRIARDRELLQARETVQAFERQLQGYQRDIEELNRTIAELQATRAWRFAVWVRARRAALRRLLPKGA